MISPTVPVSKPYILQSGSSAIEGLSFWMHCSVENGTEPIQYIWEQENRSGQVSTLAENNSSLFNMTLVTRNNTGWFRCLARNEVNEQRSDQIWIDVLCESNFHITLDKLKRYSFTRVFLMLPHYNFLILVI